MSFEIVNFLFIQFLNLVLNWRGYRWFQSSMRSVPLLFGRAIMMVVKLLVGHRIWELDSFALPLKRRLYPDLVFLAIILFKKCCLTSFNEEIFLTFLRGRCHQLLLSILYFFCYFIKLILFTCLWSEISSRYINLIWVRWDGLELLHFIFALIRIKR